MYSSYPLSHGAGGQQNVEFVALFLFQIGVSCHFACSSVANVSGRARKHAFERLGLGLPGRFYFARIGGELGEIW